MKPWKAALGVGAACAACCAVPLLGGAAALTFGSATLAAAGSALLACADDLAPLGLGLIALGAVGAGVIVWRRRRRAAQVAALNGATGATARACALPASGLSTCGCGPGACR